MDTSLYLAFLVVSFGLIIIPGPNVLVIVSTSIAHGRKRGLQAVAGTSFAMALQLLLVAISTAWFIQIVSDGIFYLKWIGVVYLLYLGLSHLRAAFLANRHEEEITASATFTRAFLISITNPKTLLFFSAFLPQFVSSAANYSFQIWLLSFSFLVLAIVLDSCYALISSKLTTLTKRHYLSSIQNGYCGLLFLVASVWLAATNRSA